MNACFLVQREPIYGTDEIHLTYNSDQKLSALPMIQVRLGSSIRSIEETTLQSAGTPAVRFHERLAYIPKIGKILTLTENFFMISVDSKGFNLESVNDMIIEALRDSYGFEKVVFPRSHLSSPKFC